MWFQPPIIPRVSYDGDTRNFDDYPDTDWKSAPSVGEMEQKLFEDFWTPILFLFAHSCTEGSCTDTMKWLSSWLISL